MKNDFLARFFKYKDEFEWLYMELYNNEAELKALEKGLEALYEARPNLLKALDNEREGKKWYLNRNNTAITMYTDLFASNLKGLCEKVPYLKELGITYLHLMPLLSMPEFDNDGGYAVSDFNTVDSRFGSNEDLETLTTLLRENGISLCLDFVMNHTSSSHEWVKKGEMGDTRYQDRYLCYDDRTIPDMFEKTVPEVFPSTAPGNFTFNEKMNKWVFTSFYPFQYDLNYKNPEVFREMLYSLLRLANMGVEIFRIDAVPYIWKELGTNCRNLPQVHTIVRLIRLALEIVAPCCILKGEVVMAPKELAAYFGTTEKPECHILYNVSTMVNLWEALASQNVELLKCQIEDILSLPSHCDFLNYLRCHDDIGWGLNEDRERVLGIDPLDHKIFLYKFYSGEFAGSYSRGELYNFDEVSLDARSCGTTASLCGIEEALEEGDEVKLKRAYERFFLMYGTMFALKGIPMINSGDEIGQLNDYTYKLDKNRVEDSRNLHRSKFNHERAQKRFVKGSKEEIIWSMIQSLENARKELKQFDTDSYVSTWDSHNDHVLAIKREKEGEDLLVVSSFSDKEEFCHFDYFMGEYEDVFTGLKVVPGWGFNIQSHSCLYLKKVK